MITVRKGAFECKGQLKGFDYSQDELIINLDSDVIITFRKVDEKLLRLIKNMGVNKLKNSVIDVILGQVFVNSEKTLNTKLNKVTEKLAQEVKNNQ